MVYFSVYVSTRVLGDMYGFLAGVVDLVEIRPGLAVVIKSDLLTFYHLEKYSQHLWHFMSAKVISLFSLKRHYLQSHGFEEFPDQTWQMAISW